MKKFRVLQGIDRKALRLLEDGSQRGYAQNGRKKNSARPDFVGAQATRLCAKHLQWFSRRSIRLPSSTACRSNDVRL